jgi:hypothetical protein
MSNSSANILSYIINAYIFVYFLGGGAGWRVTARDCARVHVSVHECV